MRALPPNLNHLISTLSRLPGIGPRSAERLALYLAQAPAEVTQKLAEALQQSRQSLQLCDICGGLSESATCEICGDHKREAGLVCLVERPLDIFVLEKSATYRGKYHVLGGKISPLDGVGPEDLRIEQLEERLSREPIKELILALPSDVEGDATSHYLARHFQGKVKVSRIAQGLPAGTSLDFADDLTLARALEDRRLFEP